MKNSTDSSAMTLEAIRAEIAERRMFRAHRNVSEFRNGSSTFAWHRGSIHGHTTHVVDTFKEARSARD